MKSLHSCAAAVLAVALAGCAAQQAGSGGRGEILIDGKGVHPESITSSKDGSLFTGSITGTIYRAGPQDSVAKPFITPSPENGLRATFGVLADDKGGKLWVCSIANPFARGAGPAAPSEVAAFDLKTGKLAGRWPFPGGGICNDLAIGPDGATYATDTPGGRILKLPKGGNALEVAVADERLVRVDGLAFSGDGKLYVNNVRTNDLWRVDLPAAGKPAVFTRLNATRKMEGPDGLRPIGGNRFLQAESTAGRITLVTIDGDNANIEVLREGLDGSAGVTLIGHTIYTAEGKIRYLVNPDFRGKDPGEFKAIAIPLPR